MGSVQAMWTLFHPPIRMDSPTVGWKGGLILAVYKPPERGGAICEWCGVLVPSWRTMPAWGGCRVRYHRCSCGWTGKSVEQLTEEVIECEAVVVEVKYKRYR